jgi:pimeloyl-ACP methyl ester carboxylesterase
MTQQVKSGVLAASLVLVGCGAHLANAPASAAADSGIPVQSGYAEVRGIRIYYEKHGTSSGDLPLVVLPGGGSTIEASYGRILPFLAQHRQVIAIEEQNHGRSGHRDVPERFSDSAEDVAAVLAQLGLSKVDLMGFSNGGSIAMQVALRHRGLVRKLVFAGSMTKKSGAAPKFWEAMSHGSFDDMPQQLKEAFLKVNPDQEQLRDMYDKDAERMRNFVETSDEDVRSLDVPTLILTGDHDVPTNEHAVELSHLIAQSQLLIVPGTHGEYLGEELQGKPGSRYPEITALLIGGFLHREGKY